MSEQVKFKYHFEPQKGWMNDPNGLIEFNGQYHAFFQHYPHDTVWGPMHWGHAVTNDFINWTELPIAMYPDMPYEMGGGCWSGSAIEKDGKLYLFYSSVATKTGLPSPDLNEYIYQTVSVAVSEDGKTFKKYEGNPVIRHFPEDGCFGFRDPKVFYMFGKYYMLIGSGKNDIGRVLFYTSEDLYHWNYEGILIDNQERGDIYECPDLFQIGNDFVLMYSKKINGRNTAQFVIGNFDGKTFTPRVFCEPEHGPQFYAPQTFLAKDGRRILFAWYYDWNKKVPEGAQSAGAFVIPRELTIKNGTLCSYPVKEARHLLTHSDELVKVSADKVELYGSGNNTKICYEGKVDSVDVLRDTKGIEVFINHGEANYSYWFEA